MDHYDNMGDFMKIIDNYRCVYVCVYIIYIYILYYIACGPRPPEFGIYE